MDTATEDYSLFLVVEIKCADCGCLPSECVQSVSSTGCKNCELDECCCWNAVILLGSAREERTRM